MYESFRPFSPAEYQIKFATESWEQRCAAALRRAVFCEEQGVFTGDDRDAIDDAAIPIVAVSLLGVAAGDVVGTVRIHQPEPGIWWGSRLAVATEYRAGALGVSLIRLAVCAAHARGAKLFFAHVQAQNVKLFQNLNWHSLKEIELFGRPHHLMRADLSAYPPMFSPETGFRAPARHAA